MKFDDTHTDLEFQRRLKDADKNWMRQAARTEPDLYVRGLSGSLMSKLLSLFSGRDGR